MPTPPLKQISSRPTELDTSMRAKQLASSVRQGRKLTFLILDEYPIEGYLAGWDDDTYFVVYEYEGEVFKTLIPKSNILRITLSDKGTFREEKLYEKMNEVVRPFRTKINNTYFQSAE